MKELTYYEMIPKPLSLMYSLEWPKQQKWAWDLELEISGFSIIQFEEDNIKMDIK